MNSKGTKAQPCECNWPSRAIASEHFPISFDDEMGEYHLQTTPDGFAILRFCPWCGGAFPKSKRGSFFTEPLDNEVEELKRLLSSIANVNEMRQILGEPDHTMPGHQDNKQWVCQYTYSTKWESLELHIHESPDGKLTFIRGGKHKSHD